MTANARDRLNGSIWGSPLTLLIVSVGIRRLEQDRADDRRASAPCCSVAVHSIAGGGAAAGHAPTVGAGDRAGVAASAARAGRAAVARGGAARPGEGLRGAAGAARAGAGAGRAPGVAARSGAGAR